MSVYGNQPTELRYPRNDTASYWIDSRSVQRRWSAQYHANVAGVIDRWEEFLTDRDRTLEAATERDAVAYLAGPLAAVTSSTAMKHYNILAPMYAWLKRKGEVTIDPWVDIDRPRESAPDPERIREVPADAYERLMKNLRPGDINGARDGAIISLMFWCGLRRSEVVSIDIERVNFDQRMIQVYSAKSEAWRAVPIFGETMSWLKSYRRHLRRAVADAAEAGAVIDIDHGPLFRSAWNGSRQASDQRMGREAVSRMLKRRSGQTFGWAEGTTAYDLKPAVKITAHQFRRSFAIYAKRRGIDDGTLQMIGGWSDARLVARYQQRQGAEIAFDQMLASDPTVQPNDVIRRRRAPRRLRSA